MRKVTVSNIKGKYQVHVVTSQVVCTVHVLECLCKICTTVLMHLYEFTSSPTHLGAPCPPARGRREKERGRVCEKA